MPSSWQARITLRAISPRLAIKILVKFTRARYFRRPEDGKGAPGSHLPGTNGCWNFAATGGLHPTCRGNLDQQESDMTRTGIISLALVLVAGGASTAAAQ